MRVAVAGTGAFGRNHLRVYRELEWAGLGVSLAAAIEPDGGRAADTATRYGIPVFGSVAELLAADLGLDAVSVAVPTVHHHAVAGELLEAGLDVLIEKPLAANLDQADELIRIAATGHGEKGPPIVQVGHLERFNPAVLAVQPRLKRPMFFEAHRLSVFTPRSLDVDVVLDLMIHDLDIVLTFANSPVREVRAVGLPILSPKVDIANVRVELESGCVANFTASRVSTERVRKLRFFEPRQYVSIDYARRELLVIRLDSGMPGTLPPEIAAMLASGKADPAMLAQLARRQSPQPRAVIREAGGCAGRASAAGNRIVSRFGPYPASASGHSAPGPGSAGAGAGDPIHYGRPRSPRRAGEFLRGQCAG